MSANSILLIFPNQLFEQHPGISLQPERIALIEDSLFFGDAQYPAKFHKQKLWMHRATMKRHAEKLTQQGWVVDYVEYAEEENVLESYLATAFQDSLGRVIIADVVDHTLEKRLDRYCRKFEIEREVIETPLFLNSGQENTNYRADKKRWFMADFYKHQRRRLGVLMDGDQPVGGQWSFDQDNRKKIPKRVLSGIPQLEPADHDLIDLAARDHVNQHFPDHPGSIDQLIYPTSHEAARSWLNQFLHQRFALFGDYEDAIEQNECWLWHSVLTPMLNIGLLTPAAVLSAALEYGERSTIPLNSLEGFVRQVIGWREFMRATYEDLGATMRTTNHWNHQRSIPASFYDGTTGLLPIDDAIRRILDTGYCHHIERLMVLGGFMFLCEFDPDEIYLWFMEMFVDSYDWVMVPNVYAMSQHADGGLITTKPYFSGSAYVRKMSHYPKDDWCQIWDGLYWRWIWRHVDDLAKNPRWAMMCAMAKKMDPVKRSEHLQHADNFLSGL
ncbi:MAG: cryptochrome/photolyase family protein [Mariniblastus sp.]|nr:cryptochrome/photolyase family protein [Mariniblastus sp.]